MRKAVSVVNKAAKANVRVGPDATGQLKKSLGVKVKIYGSGVVIGVVEPRPGFRVLSAQSVKLGRKLAARGFGGKGVRASWGGPTYHDPRLIAHLVEYGTQARRQKKTLRFTGQMPSRPFLVPALFSSEGKVEAIFADEVGKALAEATR